MILTIYFLARNPDSRFLILLKIGVSPISLKKKKTLYVESPLEKLIYPDPYSLILAFLEGKKNRIVYFQDQLKRLINPFLRIARNAFKNH